MGKKDIVKYQFKKGNKKGKGRPKKLLTKILETLKEDGELVTRQLVQQTYQVLLSLSEDQLKTIANDKKQPMINRIVSKEMLGKNGFETIEKMLDRANGRATQMHQQSIDMKVSKDSLTDEEIEERLRQLDKD